MFFSLQKFQQRVKELGERRYTGWMDLFPFTSMEGITRDDAPFCKEPPVISGTLAQKGDLFEGRDRYLWLEKTVTLPQVKKGCDLVGFFDFGKTGGGTNRGFESLLYIDSKAYQGVDSNHPDVILTPYAGRTITMTFLLWTGLEGGGQKTVLHHRLSRADIGYLHRDASELYYLMNAMTEALEFLPEESNERIFITGAVDRTLKLLDWDRDRLLKSVPEALALLKRELEQHPKSSPITIYAVGHTHIDVAWLWRLKHTREKAQRSFATVLRLMEEYDEYIFLQTQPQIYSYLKQDNPQLYERLKKRVLDGRWEADGGMWLEADCNISSGESLVRQLLYGIRFFKEEFGVECEYLWLPDAFGYSWALPQILKQCRLTTFMTTKISWNQYNRIPNDLFRWRGIDGTEILTYFITTPAPNRPLSDYHATYNGMINARTVTGSWKKFVNKDLTQQTLISYGYGDGGGGVNREMLENRRALDMVPGIPNVKTGRAGDFFRRLHEDVEHTDRYVPVWDGELYMEGHRGTYTSQSYNKKMNRKLEFLLTETEWLAVAAALQGREYPAKALHDCWETVLRHQFHDIIPGSSIHEVYEDSRKEYGEAVSALEKIRTDLAQALFKEQKDSWSVFHFGSFDRNEIIMIPENREGIFYDKNGRALPGQKTENGWLVLAPVAAISMAEFYFAPGKAPDLEIPFAVFEENRILETPFYHIEWSEDGTLTSIYDCENRREVLGGHGNLLCCFEDKPLRNDAWDIDIFHTQKYEDLAVSSVKCIECGPLRTILRFCYQYRASAIEQDMIVYRNSRRIDFVTRVDWHEDHRLLKALFETDIRSTRAAYDIQFGYALRATHWNTSWDWARFEVCGHKWADFSENDYGVSLLNNCKYGYSIHDKTMAISLLKSAKHPDTAADMGRHEFTYALYPHAGNLTRGGTIEESVALNLPVTVLAGAPIMEKLPLRVEGSAVYVDAVKRAEDADGFVIRLHEFCGGRAEAILRSDWEIKGYAECNMLEEYDERVNASEVTVSLRPFEIKNLRIWF